MNLSFYYHPDKQNLQNVGTSYSFPLLEIILTLINIKKKKTLGEWYEDNENNNIELIKVFENNNCRRSLSVALICLTFHCSVLRDGPNISTVIY